MWTHAMQFLTSVSGPNRPAKVTDHFTWVSVNVIYSITYILYKKIYIGKTGRRLASRFREHLPVVEKKTSGASKPVNRHFNLPNHSQHNMSICGLLIHHGNTESRKNLKQKFILQLGTLYPHGINEHLSFPYVELAAIARGTVTLKLSSKTTVALWYWYLLCLLQLTSTVVVTSSLDCN